MGTLRRCLEKLEGSSSLSEESGETSRALSQILDTAYNLEFNERTSTSAVRLFVERIKQTFQVHLHLHVCMHVHVQWNPSNVDTLGTW